MGVVGGAEDTGGAGPASGSAKEGEEDGIPDRSPGGIEGEDGNSGESVGAAETNGSGETAGAAETAGSGKTADSGETVGAADTADAGEEDDWDSAGGAGFSGTAG